jgi:hypothetical protein
MNYILKKIERKVYINKNNRYNILLNIIKDKNNKLIYNLYLKDTKINFLLNILEIKKDLIKRYLKESGIIR